MSSFRRVGSGSALKNFVIVGLCVVIVVLFVSDALTDLTKKYFFYFLAFALVFGVIFYLLYGRRKLDIWKIAQDVIDREYQETGNNVNIADLTIVPLHTDYFGISFESVGRLISYQWDMRTETLMARSVDKIGAMKREVNDHEVLRAIAMNKIKSPNISMRQDEGIRTIDNEEDKEE